MTAFGKDSRKGQHMTKDDAPHIALNAILGCTYDERMRAIGVVQALALNMRSAAVLCQPFGIPRP